MTFFESSSRSSFLVEYDVFSENRYPPRIKSGAGFFGIMLWSRDRHSVTCAVAAGVNFTRVACRENFGERVGRRPTQRAFCEMRDYRGAAGAGAAAASGGASAGADGWASAGTVGGGGVAAGGTGGAPVSRSIAERSASGAPRLRMASRIGAAAPER